MQRKQQCVQTNRLKESHPGAIPFLHVAVIKHLNKPQAIDSTSRSIQLFSLTLFMLLFSTSIPASLLLDAGWEAGGVNDYYFTIPPNNDGATIIDAPVVGAPACTGTRSLKSELIFGKGSVRSQVVLDMEPFNSFENVREYWFAFAVYLPDSFLPDEGYEDMIWALHGRADSADGELSRDASIAIRTQGDQWLITYIKDSNYSTYQAGDTKRVYEETGNKTIGKFQTGRWTIFVINTLYDYRSRGFLKIWKDAELVIDKSNGIGFNDKAGPFVSMGLYKSIWDLSKEWGSATNVSSRLIYFDDFRVGDDNTSYEQIAPVCASTSPAKLSPPGGLKLEILR